MRSLKLNNYLNIYIFLVTLLLSLAFVFFYSFNFQKYAIGSLSEYGETLTKNAIFNVADYLFQENYTYVEEFVQELSKRPRVKTVTIVDFQGTILADTDPAKIGRKISKLQFDDVKSQKGVRHKITADEQEMIINSDVGFFSHDIGYIRVTISMDHLWQELRDIKRKGLLIAFIGWILSVIIANLGARIITAPLTRLSKWAKHVAAGNLTYENIPFPSLEVLETSRSFTEVVRSFEEVADICEAVAVGDLSHSVKIRSADDRLGIAVNRMVENFKAVVSQANTIANGDYSVQVSPRSSNDELGITLSHMARALARISEENKAALAEAQRLVAHLDNLPTPVFSIDPFFKVTYMNPAGAAMVGLTPLESMGRNCADLFNTPLCNTGKCPMRLAMSEGRVINGETSTHQRGQSLPVKYTSVAFRDKKGTILGGLEYFVDITEIKQAVIEDEFRNSLRKAQMEISDQLRGEWDEIEICNIFLKGLVRHISFQTGAFYLLDEDDVLQLIGSYASRQSINPTPHFKLGEGICGQAALEKRQILLSRIPPDYVKIFSGTGEALPRYILVVPILFEEQVKGVVELGSFTEFNQFSRELLDSVIENVGIVIHTAQSRSKMTRLLEQTRQQAEKLQSQQEELQVTNEELANRTLVLEKQQNEVKEKNEELARQRNELQLKTKELETSSRYKSEFLANMSHELRTPLNSILILSQLFAANKDNNLSEKQLEYARTINTSGKDLLNLINEVLDLAKVEAGQMRLDFKPLDLRGFLTDMEQVFSPVATERGITLTTELSDELPVTIRTDSQRLRQIVKNLLSNALKFTAKGNVLLQINRPETGVNLGALTAENIIAINVIDTGIGIAPNKQQLVFEAFQQEDGSISRKYGGTGLGLSIVRELTALLGGEIHLKSELGQGCTFTVLLPETTPEQVQKEKIGPLPESPSLEITPVAEKPETRHVDDDRNNLRTDDNVLLIVEDDPAFVQILVDLAHERNFKCIVAEDGESGIHYADFYQPGAIILDIDLPGIDGWQVMDCLHNNSKTSRIPIHVISAADKITKARQKGATGYLTKPVGVEKIKETLGLLAETTFSQHQVKDELPEGKQGKLAEIHNREDIFKAKKVLVVDDDMRNVFALSSILEEKGMDVLGAENGKKGLEMLTSTPDINVVLMDIMMPGMDGFEAIAEIRSQPRFKKLPIIALTAKAMRGDRQKCIEAGANDYLAKPVDGDRLLSMLRVWLYQ